MSALTASLIEELLVVQAPEPERPLADQPLAVVEHPRQDRPSTRSGPRVRLLPAPPPPATPVAVGPALAIPPTVTRRIAVLRSTDRSPVLEAADEARGPTPAADPAQVGRTVAHAVVEVLLGRRPVAQLARWVTPGVYATVQGRAALTARVLGPRHVAGRGATVRRTRVCVVDEHACEVSVVVDDGSRVRAVALRLETHRGTWRTTSLEVG
ncbi:Rv3235 family protein [Cellulomonas edaphi]|uniref:Rv3235 family protein n=1 Tax=Cellulomonas edaphi TaxID=3053468 RepID=A0ABT7S7X1_9CELL|nr:Rv3235 family protein [Cellulomons edaphi]MDM7831720.1 Rv3235 family protein [Cellulomons edaphi]